MAGLVSYGDSDEEFDRGSNQMKIDETAKATPVVQRNIAKPRTSVASKSTQGSSTRKPESQRIRQVPADRGTSKASKPSAKHVSISPDEKTQIQRFTMPPLPNYDLPAVANGEPSRQAAQQVATLLQLKKGGDKHYNVEAARSSEFHNPGSLPVLEEQSGLSFHDSVSNTLPPYVWNASSLPAWASAREVNKRQAAIHTKKDTENRNKPREKIDFVKAKQGGQV